MGLDMYLHREHYLSMNQAREVASIIGVEDASSLSQVTENAIYWRKANHIHKWFVENVQNGVDDCGRYYVSREHLETLRDLCKEIVDDPVKGPDLLPTQSGFFFGGTEYDDYYMDDVETTLLRLDELLMDKDSHDFYYSSSW